MTQPTPSFLENLKSVLNNEKNSEAVCWGGFEKLVMIKDISKAAQLLILDPKIRSDDQKIAELRIKLLQHEFAKVSPLNSITETYQKRGFSKNSADIRVAVIKSQAEVDRLLSLFFVTTSANNQ